MRRISFALATLVVGIGFSMHAPAAEKLFSGAQETDGQLQKLYDAAGDLCLRNPSRDVRVAVACKSMTIYGLALNERGWCNGRKQEANAEKQWHRCESDSDRFSVDQLTKF